MTNLAVALTQDPTIARGIKQVVLMGGAFLTRGNVTPAAEFNIYVDPHAAAVVFASGLPIVVLPQFCSRRYSSYCQKALGRNDVQWSTGLQVSRSFR
jgi:inosine-uridine nucleoside N-ribohydrolase